MVSPQRQSFASKEAGRRRAAGAAPDEARHGDGSRLSEIDEKESRTFEQVRLTSKACLVKVSYQRRLHRNIS